MDVSLLTDNKVFRYFCYILLGELFLMGSGAELQVAGFLTLRMINFLVAVGLSVYFIVRSNEFPKTILWFFLAHTILLLFGYIQAVLIEAPVKWLLEDLKPLSYFYILLFFYYMMDSERMMRKTVSILLMAVKIMTVIYLIYMTVTDLLGLFEFSAVYKTLSSDSFTFRGVGSSIYYKGFVFLPIGCVGFFQRKQYIWLFLTTAAIYLTYTRGLYVLLAIGLTFYYLKTRNVNIITLMSVVAVGIMVYCIADYFELFKLGNDYADNREESDEIRFRTIRLVFDEVTAWSAVFGHGLGHGVEGRPAHMEITYLEFFHKQGIVGLLFWAMFLWNTLMMALSVPKKNKDLGDFFLTSSLMIYVQSFFNPYINNPIGMSIVLLAFAVCYRLSQDERFADCSTV